MAKLTQPSLRLTRTLLLAMLSAIAQAAFSADESNITGDPATWPTAIRDANSKALDAYERHDTAAACLAYRDALDAYEALGSEGRKKISFAAAELYLDLGRLDENEGRLQDAEKDYANALAAARIFGITRFILRAANGLESVYFKEGNCQRAIAVVEQERKAFGATSWYANDDLPATVTMAKCEAQRGLKEAAKSEFDAAWAKAESKTTIEPELVKDLQLYSIRLYRSMGLNDLADSTDLSAKRMLSKPQIAPIRVAP